MTSEGKKKTDLLFIQVLDLISNDNSYFATLESNTQRFRTEMTAAGFAISGDNHPICPVMVGEASLAGKFADKMLGIAI